MSKKIGLLFPILLLTLGCQNSNQEISLKGYTFTNKLITVNIKSDSYNSFNIYTKEVDASIYQYAGKTNGYSFSYSNPNLDVKFVPLVNNKEVIDKAKEFNYFNMTLSSSNIHVFDEGMSATYMNDLVDNTYQYMREQEFEYKRPTFLLLPGEYDDLVIENGYYTSFIGLGEVPTDVIVKKIQVDNHPGTGNALINFWRSNENFHVSEDSTWATSQAAPLRRMSFSKGLTLSNFEEGKENWSSGGYISNSRINGDINSGTQQQFYLRNSKFNAYSHSNFNMVFEGCLANYIPPTEDWESVHSTEVEVSEIVKEKSHLVYEPNMGLGIRTYPIKANSKSISWEVEETSSFIPISECYVVNNDDDVNKIQAQYDMGKHLIFLPGRYHMTSPLNINRNNSEILGLGLVTLIADNESAVMNISAKGVSLSSFIFQAGSHSESLLNILEAEGEVPTTLNDVFFRVGGEDFAPTYVDTCLNVEQDDVILDHLWIWRADHGASGGIGWSINVSNQGIVVSGDNVTAHCLMVEHYEKYQTTWLGENGKTIFYQSETPYDASSQEEWQRGDEETKYGYPSYKIGEEVENHTAIGLGIYYFQKASVPVYCYSAIEAPNNTEISMKHMVARYFGGNGKILNTINDIKGNIDGSDSRNLMLLEYPTK